MADVEVRREFGAGAMCAVNLKQKIPGDRSTPDAYSKSRHADPRGKKNAAQDDADVVDKRRERRDNELAFRVLNRAQNAALIEADLSGEHDPRQKDYALPFGRTESRGDDEDEFMRKNLA